MTATARRLAALLVLGPLYTPASADSPLGPPKRHTVCSQAEKICATSDPVQNVTVVALVGSPKARWSIPGWHRWLFVSDDGRSVVVGYAGMNLVPQDVTLGQAVLSFYDRSRLARTVTLGDLYRDKGQLRATVSHLAWTNDIGFNQANQLVVELVNGERIAFDARTGLPEKLKPDGT